MGINLTGELIGRPQERPPGDALSAVAYLIRNNAQDLAAVLGVDEALGLVVCRACVRLFRPTIEGQYLCGRTSCTGMPAADGSATCGHCGGPFTRTRRRTRFCSQACSIASRR